MLAPKKSSLFIKGQVVFDNGNLGQNKRINKDPFGPNFSLNFYGKIDKLWTNSESASMIRTVHLVGHAHMMIYLKNLS